MEKKEFDPMSVEYVISAQNLNALREVMNRLFKGEVSHDERRDLANKMYVHLTNAIPFGPENKT